jgi:hypothetical protein
MAQFRRSRLEKKAEDEITKKTVFLGLMTIVLFTLIVIFGLPFLIKFSIILGEVKNRTTVDIKEKVIPPLAPRLILPFEATNSSRIAVKGLAEKNVMIELLKNDVSVGKVAANDAGEFEFGDILLDQGESTFTAIAISDNGGSSEPSKELTVVFDNVPPSLTMVNPSEDALKVSSPDFDVVGISDKGVSVTVNGRVAMVDDTGKFKLKYQLNSGNNDIEIIVTDLAGNETRKKISITYDI